MIIRIADIPTVSLYGRKEDRKETNRELREGQRRKVNSKERTDEMKSMKGEKPEEVKDKKKVANNERAKDK